MNLESIFFICKKDKTIMSCNKGCSVPSNKPNGGMCPMRMSDSRAFTDYRPKCAVNEEINSILRQHKPTEPVSSYNARMYLQQNAMKEIERQRNLSMKDIADCVPCKNIVSESILNTEGAERYVVRCNEVSCTRNETNPKGLGDGRYY